MSEKSTIIYLLIFGIFLLSYCDKNPSSPKKSFKPTTGIWSGSDISFTIGGDQQFVTNMKFTYSGHASGSYCSFNYTSTTTLSAEIDIDNKTFSYSSSSYKINGTFKDTQNAEIEISWTLYDSYCMAHYSGSKTYTASYKSSLNKLSEPNLEEAEDVNEIIENDTRTIIEKRYE